MYMRRLFFSLFLLLSLFFLPREALANDLYDISYTLRYTLNRDASTNVILDVDIAQKRPDLYVDVFSLTIPAVFDLDSLSATSYSGPVSYEKEKVGEDYKLSFKFANPQTGKDSHNNLQIKYVQNNLIRKTGSVYEAILPTLATEDGTDPITVIINKTTELDGPLSIAKPRPTKNDISTYVWENIKQPSLYVVFGDTQLYSLQLGYRFRNTSVAKKDFDIALPPETLYQSIVLKNLDPKPSRAFLDEDGNYIARYSVGPLQEQYVRFEGTVKVFAQPQQSMIDYTRNSFEKQKAYLLSAPALWDASRVLKSVPLDTFTGAPDIYDFVVKKLSYSYARIGAKTNSRLGAAGALESPDAAVCTEYSDTFVALAREKGIFAREIEGYAFGQDQRLQPLSLVTDVLHAWPEYYDLATQLWKPVDPTWEDTSGIDYLSGFDLNHIVFAIHGRDPVLPPPAGMYKTKDSKDVSVLVQKKPPVETQTVALTDTLPKELKAQASEEFTVTVENTGNVYLKNQNLLIESAGLTFEPATAALDPIPPYGTQTVRVRVKTRKDTNRPIELAYSIPGLLKEKRYVLVKQFILKEYYVTGVALLSLLGLYLYLHRARKKKTSKHS